MSVSQQPRQWYLGKIGGRDWLDRMRIWDQDGRIVTEVMGAGGPQKMLENGWLLAAAPDLLAALQAALDQTEDGLHQSPCDLPDCWVEKAQAAIAKAQGREP